MFSFLSSLQILFQSGWKKVTFFPKQFTCEVTYFIDEKTEVGKVKLLASPNFHNNER
jgi:hypothetical protein